MKRCPFCAEDIQDGAIKCKHCGSMLNDATCNIIQETSLPTSAVNEQSNLLCTQIDPFYKISPESRKYLLLGTAFVVVLCFIIVIASVVKNGLLLSRTPSNISTQNETNAIPTFTIRVSGDSGLHFQGNYSVTTEAGEIVSKTIDGQVPIEYVVAGTSVSCVFQKKSEYGYKLKVEILKNGVLVEQSDTTAQYGVVSVTGH